MTSDQGGKKIREYDATGIVVEYDVGRCIHAAECVRGLPSVFDPKRRPWIDPSGADVGELAQVVERCPTGALHYRRRDGGPDEQPPSSNTLRVAADGPLYLSGRLQIELPDGETLQETRAALCRCGHSQNKPFCDDAHYEAGFTDAGSLQESGLRPDEADDGGTLQVSFAPNGPIRLRGPVEVLAEGGGTATGGAGVLCRCGHSKNKPFCDSTHREVGFEAE